MGGTLGKGGYPLSEHGDWCKPSRRVTQRMQVKCQEAR
jgi:hypothetical protein